MKLKLNKIIHVDDNSNILKIVKSVLETVSEISVLSCNSGQEAIDNINEFTPDLILLDVVMPDMNGPEVLNKLRQIPSTADTPVVFMTGKDAPDKDNELDQYGAIGYITKPIAPLSLPSQIMHMWNDWLHDTGQLAKQEKTG